MMMHYIEQLEVIVFMNMLLECYIMLVFMFHKIIQKRLDGFDYQQNMEMHKDN